MSTLSVPRSLTANTNPTETQFDAMRTYLLNFFNSNNLDDGNIATASVTYTKLSGPVDDAPLKFTSNHGLLVYDSVGDYFKIQNTQGDIVFGVTSGTTVSSEQLVLRSTDGVLELGDTLYFNQSVGNQDVSMLWLLSKYRKPRLEYTSDDVVTAETNYPSKSLIAMRDRICEIYDTTLSLAVGANGETSGDSGTAVSGLGAGVTRTANRWYYVYAVQVQYGTQATGVYAILVANETSPETANITALNTAFGVDKWVYMGVIRNGYNDGTNTNVIVPFMYDECGYLKFTNAIASGKGLGITLASGAATTTTIFWNVLIGNTAAATAPGVATRIIFGGYRSAGGFELIYQVEDSAEYTFLRSSCDHSTGAASNTATIYMEVPLLEEFQVFVSAGSTASDVWITLAGLLDHYV